MNITDLAFNNMDIDIASITTSLTKLDIQGL